MRPPTIVGGNAMRRIEIEHAADAASMRPPTIVGGNSPASQGGFRPRVGRFNEAADDRRRKPLTFVSGI